MIVLACLTRPATSGLARALGPNHEVRQVAGWHQVLGEVPARGVDAVIFDPAVDAPPTAELGRLLAFGIAVIAYVELSAQGVRAAMQLGQLGVCDMVLRGAEDDPRSLRRVIEGAAAMAYGAQILGRIEADGVCLPESLWRALRLLFRRPQDFGSVGALAAAGGMTRRSLDRRLEREGLATASDLIAIARAVVGYRILRESAEPMYAVARQLGYYSARQLARQFATVTDTPPSLVRFGVPPEAFLELAVAALRPRTGRRVGRERGSRTVAAEKRYARSA